jgi:transcriptional regulator with XRE-family HTH domain
MKAWNPIEIRRLRKSLDLYQRELAELLGVTREYIILLEKGVKTPSKTLRLLLDCVERQFKEKER